MGRAIIHPPKKLGKKIMMRAQVKKEMDRGKWEIITTISIYGIMFNFLINDKVWLIIKSYIIDMMTWWN